MDRGIFYFNVNNIITDMQCFKKKYIIASLNFSHSDQHVVQNVLQIKICVACVCIQAPEVV